MSLHVEPLVETLRIFRGGRTYGDPYDAIATVVLCGDLAYLCGLHGHIDRDDWQALQDELRRLHDALATARVSADSILRSGVPGSGPVADGRAAGTGELLGECASRLVEVGGHADRLAAQVIGLQAYARLAQRACQ